MSSVESQHSFICMHWKFIDQYKVNSIWSVCSYQMLYFFTNLNNKFDRWHIPQNHHTGQLTINKLSCFINKRTQFQTCLNVLNLFLFCWLFHTEIHKHIILMICFTDKLDISNTHQLKHTADWCFKQIIIQNITKHISWI